MSDGTGYTKCEAEVLSTCDTPTATGVSTDGRSNDVLAIVVVCNSEYARKRACSVQVSIRLAGNTEQ
jgi:hypothetical protein